MGLWILLALLLALLVYAISLYNGLVAGRNNFRNAFSQIDVQLTRRYELIPNLVEAAKGYLNHEKSTLEAVLAARNGASAASKAAAANPDSGAAINALSAAEGLLGSALGRFYAVAEAYPELKADATISRLMEELASTENRIAFARQAYNDAVMNYNNSREQFPGNLVANRYGFVAASLLEIGAASHRQAPAVKF